MAYERSFRYALNDQLDLMATYITDDDKWSKIRRRTIFALLLFAILSAVQTTMIYSPQFLIGALYHGRGVGVPNVIKMDDEKKTANVYSNRTTFIKKGN